MGLDQGFWQFVKKTDNCWIWLGGKKGKGYGEYKQIYAHRYSYELSIGKISKKMFVLHSCDNKICVNYQHLFLGTRKDNAQDASRKGILTRASNQLKKTHCPVGHPYDEKNTGIRKNRNGARRCKECAKIYTRNYYKKKGGDLLRD